jgi:hypothetical protein
MTTMTIPTTRSPGAPATTEPALATRSTSDDIRAFPTVLRSEWLKFTSLRANRAVLALTVVVGGLTSWAVATLITDEVLVVSEVYIFSTVLTAVFSAVVGILLFTSEAQHGTLAAALTAQPARWLIAASKTVAAVCVGLVLGATGMAAGFLGAVVGGLGMGDTSTMAATTMWALLLTVLATLLGVGVGMIVRHGAGAISGVLVWWFVVENLLTMFVPEQLARFMPFVAGVHLLGIEADTDTPAALAVALSRPEDALVFGGYAAAALVAGTVLLYRRDTN